VYDEQTGRRQTWRGEPYRRPAGTGPPCRLCPKQGPHKGVALTPANARAVEHYRECAATGQFPDDPIVRRTAAIICELEARYRHRELVQALRTRD
jgi:hypothetical protein